MPVIKNIFFNHIYHRKFFILLIFILTWLLLEPFANKIPTLSMYLWYLYILLSIMIMYTIRPNNLYFTITSSLIILSLVIPNINLYLHSHSLKNFDLFVNVVMNFLVTINVIWYTASKKKYSKDDIFAAILAFMMIGVCFSEIYYNLHVFNPNIIHFMKTPIVPADLSGHISFIKGDFLYFSYITLATVGYGDIWPVSAIAKRLCSFEACIGVLYLALFIGRVVMMYESPEKRSKTDGK